MRVSYKGGEVQDENSTAAKGNRQNLILAEASSVMPITAKEARKNASNLLDYLGENRLK